MTAQSDSAFLRDLTVADLFQQYPQTLYVFQRHGMACAGCDVTAFETVAEAITIYRLDADAFLGELAQAAAADKGGRDSVS